MARIVSLGSALQDIYLIDHDDLASTKIGETAILGKVLAGSKVDIDKISYTVGGGGINAAVTFARHGHETIFISNLKNDAAGESILRLLDEEGIDSSYIEYNNRKSTGTSIILLDSKTGERTVLTCRGNSASFNNFSADDLDLIHPDWLYITTLYGDIETLMSFLNKAKHSNIKVALNPGDKELNPDLLRLLKYVDVLILNKNEAAKLVQSNTLAEQVNKLNGYVETVIITSGSMGGIASNRRETYRFGIYEDVSVKDVNGAGDAFGSGFIAHLATGKSFRTSLVFASANATAVIQKIGAGTGILTGKEPLHLMPIQKL